MRPVRLSMQAYGPYVGRQVVDFERLGAHGLFLIHGRTGSGKSSVLDAMCFALYGETTGVERQGRDVVSTLDPYGGTEVELEFEHLGKRYRVKRRPEQVRPKKRGSGTTVQPHSAELEDVTAGRVVADKVGAVTTEITEMLRCDAKQFRQTIVLPQGEFRKVVTDDGSRREVLANIFMTERFTRLVEGLRRKHNALISDGKMNEAKRSDALDALGVDDRAAADELLASALHDLAAALAERQRLDELRSRAQSDKVAGETVQTDFADLEAARARAQELSARTAEVRASEQALERARRAHGLGDVRRELAEKAEERENLTAELAQARQVLGEAEKELEEARLASAAIEPERPRLADLEVEAARLRHHKEQVEDAAALRADLDAARSELTAASEAHTRAKEAVVNAQEELKAKRESLAGSAAAAAALAEAKDRERAARDAVGAATELARLTAELREVDAELTGATAGDDPLAAALAEIALHAPSLLAHDLVAGEPCPVCGSVDHPEPAHGDGSGGLTGVIQRFGEGAGEVARLHARRHDLAAGALELRTSRAWHDDPDAGALDAELEAAVAVVGAAEAARSAVADLTTEVEALDAELASLTAAAAAAADIEARAANSVAGHEGAVQALLASLPEELRDPTAFGAAESAAKKALDELTQRFEQAKDRLEVAGRAVDQARRDVTGLEGRLTTAEEAAASCLARFEERLAGSGFASAEELDTAAMPAEEMADLEQSVKAHHGAAHAVTGAIASLEKKVKGKEQPNVAALERALADATEAATAATEAWNAASSRVERIEENIARYDRLAEQDAALEERKRAAKRLYDVATGQVKGESRLNLETFVLRSIFGQVLTEGNRHLRHMTGGRYRLALKEPESTQDTGLELNVHDSFSGGAERAVRTLSGGEGFLASLALALGLAEVAQQQSGSTEHGALFIDEGFGSLDPAALDNAIGILRGLPQDHRMVGIISHVDELKKRIPVQLLVEGGETGSRLEVRVNA